MADIEIYTTHVCAYCERAKRLLAAKGVVYREIFVDGDADLLDSMIKRAGGRKTVPQVFIDGRHIGGFDDLNALDKSGELDPLLKA